jgi:histidine ammonia-lyase
MGDDSHQHDAVVVDGASLTLEHVAAVARHGATTALADAARPRIAASRAVVERIVAAGTPAYGVTTGFGSLSDRVIPADQTRQLQTNLLVSHATGTGAPLPRDVVRAMLLLRANALATGASGVREVVIERLLALLAADLCPIVPCQGSLGASGDLAPLAHLALPLLGRGLVERDGVQLAAADALAGLGLTPLELEPKEALALINGTQMMAALATLALLDAERLLHMAVNVAALSCVALTAKRAAFDARIQAVRPHPGQRVVAETLLALLAGISEAPSASKRIQDPYSVRCVPQVYGAIVDALKPLRATLEIEVNAATDNPLVFADGAEGAGEVISGGNFHGHPLALGCDAAKLAVASLGTMVERRVALLVDGAERGLPPMLVAEPGVNSGYMIAHYLTAGLVAENRVLAHPSSVDSIPTSANVEDYNSMGSIAARHFRQVVINVETILAVELLCAAQACDLAQRVPPPEHPLGALHARLRAQVPFRATDHERVMADDVAAALGVLRAGVLGATQLP